jgi:4,5-DOPA dioxygenase extradiol
MLPSFFIAHGAPLLAIEDNEYTQFLNTLGRTLPKPQAIVLFSAHWESAIQQVSDVDEFETIYDFGGFPEALYRIKYPAKGGKEISKEIEELFTKQGVSFEVDTKRGLDHGAGLSLKCFIQMPIFQSSQCLSTRTSHQRSSIKSVSLYPV